MLIVIIWIENIHLGMNFLRGVSPHLQFAVKQILQHLHHAILYFLRIT